MQHPLAGMPRSQATDRPGDMLPKDAQECCTHCVRIRGCWMIKHLFINQKPAFACFAIILWKQIHSPLWKGMCTAMHSNAFLLKCVVSIASHARWNIFLSPVQLRHDNTNMWESKSSRLGSTYMKLPSHLLVKAAAIQSMQLNVREMHWLVPSQMFCKGAMLSSRVCWQTWRCPLLWSTEMQQYHVSFVQLTPDPSKQAQPNQVFFSYSSVT